MNIIALSCCITAYNENKKNQINYEFCEKLKKFSKLFYIDYFVCQLFIGLTGIKMDGSALLAIIVITIDKFHHNVAIIVGY